MYKNNSKDMSIKMEKLMKYSTYFALNQAPFPCYGAFFRPFI